MHEIEAKIQVDDLTAVAERLKAVGAGFLRTVRETDTYLDDHKKLKHQGCGLRIRSQQTEDAQKTLVTFKGAKVESRYKSRPEYETEVGSAETAELIFAGLGYVPRIVVRKKRDMWSVDGCTVCLDDVEDLGRFVEVEGCDEDCIETVLQMLHLADRPHVRKGYAEMLSKQHKKLKRECE